MGKRRKRITRAERDVRAALRPHTEKARLWRGLGKIDLGAAIARLKEPPKETP